MFKSSSSEPCTRGPSPPWLWCAQCYSNARRRSNYKGHLCYIRDPKPKYLTPWWQMKRDNIEVSQVAGEWTCPDSGFLKLYPSLAQGLCDCFFDDGKVRIPWTFSVSFTPSGCAVCLSDKGGKRYAYTNGDDLTHCLKLLEKAVLQSSVAWRKQTR